MIDAERHNRQIESRYPKDVECAAFVHGLKACLRWRTFDKYHSTIVHYDIPTESFDCGHREISITYLLWLVVKLDFELYVIESSHSGRQRCRVTVRRNLKLLVFVTRKRLLGVLCLKSSADGMQRRSS